MSKTVDEALQADIDLRLIDVFTDAWNPGNIIEEALGGDAQLHAAFAAFMRASYARGYLDALREEKAGRRGELPRAHGYPVP